jgi:putative ABC transport system substrate-binding protein
LGFGSAFVRSATVLRRKVRHARPDSLVSLTTIPKNRQLIADFALKSRLPSICEERAFVVAGGLLSYAPSFIDLYRHAATYVDKILKGAKPGDLPIQQPTTFELVINPNTAKVLGLTIPPSLRLQAELI